MARITIAFNLHTQATHPDEWVMQGSRRYVEVRDSVGRVIDSQQVSCDDTAMRDWWIVVLAYQCKGFRIVRIGACIGQATLEGEL